jgi:hypothetical protein
VKEQLESVGQQGSDHSHNFGRRLVAFRTRVDVESIAVDLRRCMSEFQMFSVA